MKTSQNAMLWFLIVLFFGSLFVMDAFNMQYMNFNTFVLYLLCCGFCFAYAVFRIGGKKL